MFNATCMYPEHPDIMEHSGGEVGQSSLGASTVYIGARTRPAFNDENAAPAHRGPHIHESIRVLRTPVGVDALGPLLALLRGVPDVAAHSSTEVL